MEEQFATIELLPKGAFSIKTIAGNTINGRFTMEVIDQFCESKNAGNYFDAINKIAMGMTVREYAELLALAVRKERPDLYQTKQVNGVEVFKPSAALEFIDDEFDGVSNTFIKLMMHALGRLGKVKNKDGAEQGATEDDEALKKKSETASTGTNSENVPSAAG